MYIVVLSGDGYDWSHHENLKGFHNHDDAKRYLDFLTKKNEENGVKYKKLSSKIDTIYKNVKDYHELGKLLDERNEIDYYNSKDFDFSIEKLEVMERFP